MHYFFHISSIGKALELHSLNKINVRLICVVRISFLSSLNTSLKCPKYISTYVLFCMLAHLILNFLLCRGSCTLMIKALLEHHRKKKLFFKLQNYWLSHSSFKRHKMNKTGILHLLPFCHRSYIRVAIQLPREDTSAVVHTNMLFTYYNITTPMIHSLNP